MHFLISLYPLLIAVFFGAVIVDVAYSQLLANTLSVSESTALYRNVSDLLLRIGFLAFLSGVAAFLAAWRVKWSRVLFVASLSVFAFEFLLPMLSMPQLSVAVADSLLGPTIRVLINLLAGTLAVAGVLAYVQFRHPPG